MKKISVGMDGNLYLDNKMNIQGSVLPDGIKERPFSLSFAIGCKKKTWRFESDFAKVAFSQSLLGAVYKFEDESCCAKVKAHVFTPFDLNDDAHLPACVFTFKIKNNSKKKRTFTFGVCMRNPLSEPIHSIADLQDAKAVLMDNAKTVSVQSDYKTYCISMQHATKVLRYADEQHFVFAESEGVRSNFAALLRCVELGCGESVTVPVIVGWHMPNLNFKQDNGENICFKDGYSARFTNALDVVTYTLTNLERLGSTVKEFTKTLISHTESKHLLKILIENFGAVCAQKPYRLVEFGKGRAFYKNRLKAKVIFAQKDVCSLWSDAFWYDTNTEAEYIAFLLESCADTERNLLMMPLIKDNYLCWEEHSIDCASTCIVVLRTYRLWTNKGQNVISENLWGKLQRIWAKNTQPKTISEQIYYYSAYICMNKMYNFSREIVPEKAVSISDCDFSAMRALWISESLGIEVFDKETISSFLEEMYMQTDIKLWSVEEMCAYLCLLLRYERINLAVALCKTFTHTFDKFLIDVHCFNELLE